MPHPRGVPGSPELTQPPSTRSAFDRRTSVLPVEIAIVFVIFATATWLGFRAVGALRANGVVQAFYQSSFGPAVMAACGREFRMPDAASVPALAGFLAEQTDSFDCAELPASTPTTPLNGFQRAPRYLLMFVAAVWRFTGVSWARLAILPGLMFGAVAALTYVVLRLALPRGLALGASVAALTSTPNVMLAPQLRDYSKGPFLLAVIAIMMAAVIGPADRRRLVALSALAGATVGFGLGFRTDLAIAVPPMIVTLALLVPAAIPS